MKLEAEMERWLPVVGFEYEVSDRGRVCSFKRSVPAMMKGNPVRTRGNFGTGARRAE